MLVGFSFVCLFVGAHKILASGRLCDYVAMCELITLSSLALSPSDYLLTHYPPALK